MINRTKPVWILRTSIFLVFPLRSEDGYPRSTRTRGLTVSSMLVKGVESKLSFFRPLGQVAKSDDMPASSEQRARSGGKGRLFSSFSGGPKVYEGR